MKNWKTLLTMLLCSGLIIASGITACGDDDEELGCAEALTTLTSDTCMNAAEVASAAVQDCWGTCDPPDDQACIDLCLEGLTLPSSCEEAVTVLLDDQEAVCGPCYVECGGVDFLECVYPDGDPASCLADLSACLGGCALP